MQAAYRTGSVADRLPTPATQRFTAPARRTCTATSGAVGAPEIPRVQLPLLGLGALTESSSGSGVADPAVAISPMWLTSLSFFSERVNHEGDDGQLTPV
jgi:hypothetical protein